MKNCVCGRKTKGCENSSFSLKLNPVILPIFRHMAKSLTFFFGFFLLDLQKILNHLSPFLPIQSIFDGLSFLVQAFTFARSRNSICWAHIVTRERKSLARCLLRETDLDYDPLLDSFVLVRQLNTQNLQLFLGPNCLVSPDNWLLVWRRRTFRLF